MGSGDGAIPDGEVAGNPDLTGKRHVMANMSRAGKSDLRAKQGVLSDGRGMPYLDQVVDLGTAPDAGFANNGAIDAGICLDLDLVFEHGRARVERLGPAAFGVASEAEAVRADDCAVAERYVVAEAAVFPNNRVRVSKEAVSGTNAGVEDHVGEDDGVVAEHAMVTDHDIRADVCTGTELGCGGDDGGGVDTRAIRGSLVEGSNGKGEGILGITDAQRRNRELREPAFDDDSSGSRLAGGGGVLGVCDEGDFRGQSGSDSGDAGNGSQRGRRLAGVGRGHQICVEKGGEFAEGHAMRIVAGGDNRGGRGVFERNKYSAAEPRGRCPGVVKSGVGLSYDRQLNA